MRLGQIRSVEAPQFVIALHPRVTVIRRAPDGFVRTLERALRGESTTVVGDVHLDAGRAKLSDVPAGIVARGETLILDPVDLHNALLAVFEAQREEVAVALSQEEREWEVANRKYQELQGGLDEIGERLARDDAQAHALAERRDERVRLEQGVTDMTAVLEAIESAEQDQTPIAAVALAEAWTDLAQRRAAAFDAVDEEIAGGSEALSPFDPEVALEVQRLHTEVEEANLAAQSGRGRKGRRRLEEAETALGAYLGRFGFNSYLSYVLAVSTATDGAAMSRERAREMLEQRRQEKERLRVERLEAAAVEFEHESRRLRTETVALLGEDPGDDVVAALRAYREPSLAVRQYRVQLATQLRLQGEDIDPDGGDDSEAKAREWLHEQRRLRLHEGSGGSVETIDRALAEAAARRELLVGEQTRAQEAADVHRDEAKRREVEIERLRAELDRVAARRAVAVDDASSTTLSELDEVLRRALSNHPWPEEVGPLPLLVAGALEILAPDVRRRAQELLVGLSEEAQVVVVSDFVDFTEWVNDCGPDGALELSIDEAIEAERQRQVAEAERLAAEAAEEAAAAARAAEEQAEAERQAARDAEAAREAQAAAARAAAEAEAREAERLAAEAAARSEAAGAARAAAVAAAESERARLAEQAKLAEAERVAAEQAEAERERAAAEQAEAERVAAERAEAEARAAEEQAAAERERVAAEQRDAEAARVAAQARDAERAQAEAAAAAEAERERKAAEAARIAEQREREEAAEQRRREQEAEAVAAAAAAREAEAEAKRHALAARRKEEAERVALRKQQEQEAEAAAAEEKRDAKALAKQQARDEKAARRQAAADAKEARAGERRAAALAVATEREAAEAARREREDEAARAEESAKRRAAEQARLEREAEVQRQHAEEMAVYEAEAARKAAEDAARREQTEQARIAARERSRLEQEARLAEEREREEARRQAEGVCSVCGTTVGPGHLVEVGGRKRKGVCIDCALVLAGVRTKQKRRR